MNSLPVQYGYDHPHRHCRLGGLQDRIPAPCCHSPHTHPHMMTAKQASKQYTKVFVLKRMANHQYDLHRQQGHTRRFRKLAVLTGSVLELRGP